MKLYFFLLMLIGTLFAESNKTTVDINSNYKVQIVHVNDDQEYWEIRSKKDNTLVFNESMLPDYNQENNTSYRHYVDINGTKLMIRDWSGGAHCCDEARLFEINQNKSITFLGKVYGGNCEAILTENTIETCDNSFAYKFGCFACSPLPTVILDEKFEFDYARMKELSTDSVDKTLTESLSDTSYISSNDVDVKIKESFSHTLYINIVHYIYAGKIDKAVDLFNQYNLKIKAIFKKQNNDFSLHDNEYVLRKILNHIGNSPYCEYVWKLNSDNKYQTLLPKCTKEKKND